MKCNERVKERKRKKEKERNVMKGREKEIKLDKGT